jgi:large subunit ribosomal protein L5
MHPRLLTRYRDEIVGKLMEEFSFKNVHQAPALTKIVINIGLGEAAANPKLLDKATEELAAITGQKASIRRARKSVANFKLRQGQAIGCMVTLRGTRMWEFLDRLLSVSLPRVRDFKGLSPKSFDGRGNYTMGVSEQTAFPEIDADKTEFVQGMDITFVTSAKSDEEAKALLKDLGFPFRDA